MKSCIKRTIPLLLALVMVVGLLTPFSEASAASKTNVINYNISSSAVSSNATDGSLPTKASPVAGQPFYFNIQVSSDLKVKKFQLYVQDVGASKYSNVYTDTANNYFRYDSYKYTFKKTGTVKYYWKLTYTDGTTTTTSKTSVTVATFNQNVSSSKASKNASDGSLPTAASTIYTGSSYYFDFQVSNNLKVKKAQLYVMDVGASKYSNVYTETANNYIRYTSYKYTFKTAGTVKYYWKLTFTDGSVDNFSNNPKSITVTKKNPISLSKCTITVKDATYTGSSITPTVTVKYGSTTLTSGTDYTLTCKNNTNVGTGTVIITGKGNYTGSVTKTFSIKAASNTITCSDVSLAKSSSKQTGNLNASAKGGATLTYSSSTSKVTVDSKGKYTVTAGWTGTATITVTAAATKNYKKTSDTVKITVSSTSISTNWSTSNYATDHKSSLTKDIKESHNYHDIIYKITVNGTKFTVGETFYTYNSSGKTASTAGGYNFVRIEAGSYVGGEKVTKAYYYDVGGAQCLGYARNIQYLLYGVDEYNDPEKFSNISEAAGMKLNSTTDTSLLKEYITDAGAGAHIRIQRNGYQHSVIVIKVDSKGFYYTDANGTSDNNIISVGYNTWSGFAEHSTNYSISYIRYYTG